MVKMYCKVGWSTLRNRMKVMKIVVKCLRKRERGLLVPVE